MAQRWQKYGTHAHLAVFDDRQEAQGFAERCQELGHPANVSLLCSLVMTSDNAPCVWVPNKLHATLAEQVSA